MKLSDNFSVSEFESKDGAEMPKDVLKNIRELAKNLQALRDYLNAPITVTSGYRSPEHNKRIGGAKNSFHVKGMAADVKVKGHSPAEVIEAIKELIEKGDMSEGGIGKYSSWTHYDIRGTKARW